MSYKSWFRIELKVQYLGAMLDGRKTERKKQNIFLIIKKESTIKSHQ